MYRTSDAKPRCLACGNEHLTEPTAFDVTGEGSPVVIFDNPTTLFGLFNARYRVNRARVCLDCGHVMLAIAGEELENLRAASQSLKPQLP
jgi:hypothetical protein